jgi:hypothetical protein
VLWYWRVNQAITVLEKIEAGLAAQNAGTLSTNKMLFEVVQLIKAAGPRATP